MSLWAEMSSPEIKESLKKKEIVIIPIGSTEQHGPHLPTGTDFMIGWEIAKRVSEKVDALLLPVVPVGFSEDHNPIAGNITFSAATLRNVVRDIAKSVAKNGAKHIVLMTAHAGHLAQLADVCYELNVCNELEGAVIHNISPYNSIAIETLAQVLEEEIFLHAEELETSIMLLLRPELVNMKKAAKEVPDFLPTGLNTPNFLDAIRIITSSRFIGRDTKTGVIGDPTLASKEKGEKLLEMLVNAVAAAIQRAVNT